MLLPQFSSYGWKEDNYHQISNLPMFDKPVARCDSFIFGTVASKNKGSWGTAILIWLQLTSYFLVRKSPPTNMRGTLCPPASNSRGLSRYETHGCLHMIVHPYCRDGAEGRVYFTLFLCSFLLQLTSLGSDVKTHPPVISKGLAPPKKHCRKRVPPAASRGSELDLLKVWTKPGQKKC